MGDATRFVREALAELGPDASLKEVGNHILQKNAAVPIGQISLAMRKLKDKLQSLDQERLLTKHSKHSARQTSFGFQQE